MTDERPQLGGPPPLAAAPQPEWLAPYVDRKAGLFMIAIGADEQSEWVGPGATLLGAVEAMVEQVVREMSAHLLGHGEESVRERERWAAGS